MKYSSREKMEILTVRNNEKNENNAKEMNSNYYHYAIR